MTGKTVYMIQTRQKVFRIVPKMSQNVPSCPKMSQNVPKCPLQTHRCPNGLFPHSKWYRTQDRIGTTIEFLYSLSHRTTVELFTAFEHDGRDRSLPQPIPLFSHSKWYCNQSLFTFRNRDCVISLHWDLYPTRRNTVHRLSVDDQALLRKGTICTYRLRRRVQQRIDPKNGNNFLICFNCWSSPST